MHYENDYIMRMLNFIKMLLEYLAGLTDAQQLEQGQDRIEKLLTSLTGLGWNQVDSLDAEQLARMMGERGEGPGRCFAIAQLLCMRADLQERLGLADHVEEWRRKALSLCLRISPPAELADPLYVMLQSLGKRFFASLDEWEYLLLGQVYAQAGYYADAEDALCAQSDPYATYAFYQRLLQCTDEELSRGNLPREEVLQGLARIEKQHPDAPVG